MLRMSDRYYIKKFGIAPERNLPPEGEIDVTEYELEVVTEESIINEALELGVNLENITKLDYAKQITNYSALCKNYDELADDYIDAYEKYHQLMYLIDELGYNVEFTKGIGTYDINLSRK